MSMLLNPLNFPLHGSRLIEASAGTGKTWTIAALYLRLVLGHGGADGFERALLPADILVMTFTRAATRELSNRVRERLVEAAAFFRRPVTPDAPYMPDLDGAYPTGADLDAADPDAADPYLAALAAAYPDHSARQQAAHRLMLAAETMDEAAIFTIDAWCQRMLREHAFDSGSLFDEELLSDEHTLFEDAAHDYWRQHVYPLNSNALAALTACWQDVGAMKGAVRELVRRHHLLGEVQDEALAVLIVRAERARLAELAGLKQGWIERANQMEQWIAGQRALAPKCFNGTKLRPDSLVKWFDALRAWAGAPAQVTPVLTDTAWHRLTPDGILDACSKGYLADAPACFEHTTDLWEALKAIEPLAHALHRHAASSIARRMDELKRRNRQFGFADMIERLKTALEGPNGDALRERISTQFPVAMIDEFQDTSPDQYAIFNLLYRVLDNDPARGLFLIGDPKQSIYGFRGADINSYLSARRATEGRHYQLGINYRSTAALVNAVNQLFLHAEGSGAHPGFAAGAFKFRQHGVNPLPFDAVTAQGRKEHLVGIDGPYQALAICSSEHDGMRADDYRAFFAHHCAEHIVALLNDPQAGFRHGATFTRLVPADIAILVRDRREAAAIRRALAQRKVLSVYLSDKDSVVDSDEAADVLRWLHAVANPLDGGLARAAFATRTAGLPLAALARIACDELAWEERVEQLKALHGVWQRQGVLAMLRRLVHELQLPSTLLRQAGGERRLTNLLHLAQLLQSASAGLDGEQALIRWFAEQVSGLGEGGDERVLRLESDAELVKVVTVHKSKGLEYPLVYLPFAVTARKTERRNRSHFEVAGADGKSRLDLALSDAALAEVERARIEEDLRLLYVALTRARHFLWLGVAALAARKAGENTLHESALGYLLGGGAAIAAADMQARWETLRGASFDIDLQALAAPEGVTLLARAQQRAPLIDAAVFAGSFERNWSVGSFTSLARQSSAAPMRAQDATLLEEAPPAPGMANAPNMPVAPTLPNAPLARTDDAPWHRFPRGPVPGNFLHEQLEWMAQEGFDSVFDPSFDARMKARCERAGWGNRQDDAIAWLRAVATTALPQLGAPLSTLTGVLPEMEFWFPSAHLNSAALDQLCTRHLLDDVARPALPERALHGMLKGFADLVFEHEGRYWILDYKSNALGPNDAAYSVAAMAAGMAAHRYDIQGALYLLALHRLLRSRLGAQYDPARQLGGALFLFLRGIANTGTRGCYLLPPDLALLDGIERLLGGDTR
ncbi:MAG: exodeoxyribonuclease V subunit beta [Massilia sp.]|nr:exodeoxyribonuclease V subunit beta [Massilia sp.]